MPDDYVTLPPMTREEVRALLPPEFPRCGPAGDPKARSRAAYDAHCKLRAALDEPPTCVTYDCEQRAVASAYVAENEPPSWCRYCEDCAAILERGGRQVKWDVERGEVSREYRVVYDQRGSDEPWELPLADPSSLTEARSRLAGFTPRNGSFNARIQQSTVTRTPWRDLEEGER